MAVTSDVLSASRNGSRLLLLMSRKPLQTASSSITGHQDITSHQDGYEVLKKVSKKVNVIVDGVSHSLKIKVNFFFSLFFPLS
jgi:tRNA A37 threonylcarbamoyladenosine synthetase subunit TsaC/SUA5/YrdC